MSALKKQIKPAATQYFSESSNKSLLKPQANSIVNTNENTIPDQFTLVEILGAMVEPGKKLLDMLVRFPENSEST